MIKRVTAKIVEEQRLNISDSQNQKKFEQKKATPVWDFVFIENENMTFYLRIWIKLASVASELIQRKPENNKMVLLSFNVFINLVK